MTFRVPYLDATLRLALPFPGLALPLRIAVVVLLSLAFAWLVRLLYRRELRSASRGIARTLLSLRLALLAAIAFLAVSDPTLTRSRTEEVPGRVLIAVDLSDSMRVTDPNRPLAEKLKLAKKLKLVGDLASDGELESWSTGSRFGSDTERQRFDQVVARIDAMPRLELCRRLLAMLVPPLREKHGLEVVGFSPEIVPLPLDAARLEKALAPIANDGRPLVCTDLKLPLNSANGEREGTKLLGVVLLTDGRHNWGASPLPKAVELGSQGVPVHAIAIGPREAPADVAVVSARAAAATVFKGSTVPIDVAVRVSGWPAGKIPVTLANPETGKPPLVETIEHTGSDAIYQLSFKAKLDEPGPQRLTVTADAGAKDRFPANNTRSVRVNVVKDRARVLLIDGEARWEFHYLQTCLGRDPNMDIRSIVFRQPRIGKVREEELKASGIPARTLPADLEALTSYDAIVLGDADLEQMTREQRLKLENYVAESGGTLVISAGKRAMPLSYASQNDEPIRRLLPIRSPQVFESVDGFPLAMTPAGERSWFLAMDDTGTASRATWEKMPLHHWAIGGDLKDGAEALATAPGGKALVSRQNFGFGRVLYIGIDSTWRWRFKTGDYYHHRFWGQVAQWAASDRLLPVSNASGTIRFGPREPVTAGGQDVEIVVRAAEAAKVLTPAARKAARIVRLPATAGGAEIPAGLVLLQVPEGRPRDLQCKVPDLTPGKYAVELDIPEWAEELVGPPGSDGRAEKLRAYFEVVPPDNEEMIDLSANWTLLQEMADASSGEVVPPENAERILELLASKSATRQVTMERPIRHSWLSFAVIVVLLALEWILRKWAGLP